MSSYNIRFLLSTDFTEDQWRDYQQKFDSVFKKGYSIEYFKRKYSGACKGYSFHGVLFCNEEIVGMYTAIPRIYFFLGQETIIAQGCDAFILPEHRKDETFLMQIFEIVAIRIKELNILYHISIPNQTAYPYWKNYVGCKDIANLNYFILPLRAGNVIGKWRFLNVLSVSLFKMLAFLGPSVYHSRHYNEKEIKLKRNAAYFSERFDSEYEIRINSDQSGFVYLNYKEDGVRTAYLIDCFPLSKRNISRALRQIIIETDKQTDVIIFIGKIETYPFYFIKVPKSKEPRLQPFIGYCLNDEYKDLFFDIKNWEISLANFDNR
jgi:hypothetical protein